MNIQSFYSATIITWIAIFLCLGFFFTPADADVWVNGYTKKNGTYVSGYYRSNPDGNPYNNWSYPGNTNPHTGVTATGDPDAYLRNYYGSSSGSSGSSYSGYSSYSSYLTTPTCPLMAIYDSLSKNCKCMSGYVAHGSSCVSADSICHDQLGIMSSYDTFSDSCACDRGYVIDGGKCVSGDSICHKQMGIMSSYSSLTKSCSCDYGYQLDSSGQCTRKKDTSSYSSAYSASASASYLSCPEHSHESATDSSKCTCDAGYQVNASKDACIPVPIKVVSKPSPSPQANTCSAYGIGAILKNDFCYCSEGYRWNSTVTTCEVGKPTFTQNLSIGSTGREVVDLHNFLALKSMYFGRVDKTYDNITAASVSYFQTMNNIPYTGTVGPQTRMILNAVSK